VSEPVIRYAPRGDATPEDELDALISVYRYVLERHAEKLASVAGSRPAREGGADATLTKEADGTSSVHE
jgi:hypothetical protein